ncbi:MAG: hypothetical protein AAGF12_28200 [Myxococcota bacterium]
MTSFGPVVLSRNYASISEVSAARVSTAIFAVAREFEKAEVLLIPSAERPKLSVEGMQTVLRVWRSNERRVSAGAIWVRRTGFAAAATRSFITKALMLRKDATTPLRVSGDHQEIAAFLSEHAVVPVDEVRLGKLMCELVDHRLVLE